MLNLPERSLLPGRQGPWGPGCFSPIRSWQKLSCFANKQLCGELFYYDESCGARQELRRSKALFLPPPNKHIDHHIFVVIIIMILNHHCRQCHHHIHHHSICPVLWGSGSSESMNIPYFYSAAQFCICWIENQPNTLIGIKNKFPSETMKHFIVPSILPFDHAQVSPSVPVPWIWVMISV